MSLFLPLFAVVLLYWMGVWWLIKYIHNKIRGRSK